MKKLLILVIALITQSFPAFAETNVLNDAEIAGIVLAVNQAEINAGSVAQSASSHPEVKLFAQRLADEHSKSSSQFNAWANDKKVTPHRSSISDSLLGDEEKFLEKLKRQKGILFDLDYINHEVESHQQALDIWDRKLIPNARDKELSDLLSQMRTRLAGHLEDAKLIKVSLGRKK